MDQPQWFIDLYLDTITQIKSNLDKFSNTYSARVESEGMVGNALYQPEDNIFVFTAKKYEEGEATKRCNITTTLNLEDEG